MVIVIIMAMAMAMAIVMVMVIMVMVESLKIGTNLNTKKIILFSKLITNLEKNTILSDMIFLMSLLKIMDLILIIL